MCLSALLIKGSARNSPGDKSDGRKGKYNFEFPVIFFLCTLKKQNGPE